MTDKRKDEMPDDVAAKEALTILSENTIIDDYPYDAEEKVCKAIRTLDQFIRAASTPSADVRALREVCKSFNTWIENEIFDDDARDHLGSTQEERAENISELLVKALNHTGGE